MTLFLTVVLILSTMGMVALLSLRQWELTTGKVILGGARPRIGAFFHRVLVTVEKGLPLLLRVWSERTYVMLRAKARDLLARTLIFLEHMLETSLNFLRRSTAEPRSGQASAFLREVAAYKKVLMRRRHREATPQEVQVR